MNIKKRGKIYNIIEIILIILICLFLFWLNLSQIASNLNKDMMTELTNLKQNITDVTKLNNKTDENYKLLQKHLARLADYYLHNTAGKDSKKNLKRIKDLLGAEGMYIIDSNGNTLTSVGIPDNVSFTDDMFQNLRDVSKDHPLSEMVFDIYYYDENNKKDTKDQGTGFLPDEVQESMEDDDSTHTDDDDDDDDDIDVQYGARLPLTYFSYFMDSDKIVVICNNYENYNKQDLVRQTSYEVMTRAIYGKTGFYFTTSADGYTIISPDCPLYTDDFNEFYLPKSCLKNGYSGLLTLNGHKYFCTLKKRTQDEEYLVCTLPIRELVFTIAFTCLTIVAAVLISLLLMSFYARTLSPDSFEKKNNTDYFKNLRRRLFVLTLLCICFTAAVGVAFHTLYNYAFTVSNDAEKADILRSTIISSTDMANYGNEDYHEAVSTFMTTAEALISEEPSFTDREKLEELAKILGVEHILIYDKTGNVIASDRNYTDLSLSKDPKDMSSQFYWIIRGEPILIQDEVDENYLNEPYLYSGVPLIDKAGEYQGMVQLAIDPAFRDNMVASTSFKSILASFDEPGRTTVFAVDMATKIVHSSSYEYDNQTAEDLGITKDKLVDEYAGFYQIQKEEMLGCCKTSGNYWVIIASYTDKLPIESIKSGIKASLPGLMAEIIFFLLLLFVASRQEGLLTKEGHIFNTVKPESEIAELHILSLIRIAAICVALCITIIVFIGGTLFRHDTTGYYIFVYPWSKGINIFTITRCLNFLCIVAFVMFIIRKLLILLASLLSSKQETVMRLLLSFIRYFGWLAAICYCLNFFGMPTGSLVASAGVLTCVFSIGAQSIVADILTGLFIIFEGSFKVGDMITVDDWHGKVVEIGIRNTTIRDLVTNDIKIMNNSTIKKVINFSEYPSRCAINIGIEYNMDLSELETIIEKEKPIIEQNMPPNVESFRYLGVEEFADSSMVVRFEVTCKNQDYLPVQRALRREIKMMFDRNDINVPFPQVVLHEDN